MIISAAPVPAPPSPPPPADLTLAAEWLARGYMWFDRKRGAVFTGAGLLSTWTDRVFGQIVTDIGAAGVTMNAGGRLIFPGTGGFSGALNFFSGKTKCTAGYVGHVVPLALGTFGVAAGYGSAAPCIQFGSDNSSGPNLHTFLTADDGLGDRGSGYAIEDAYADQVWSGSVDLAANPMQVATRRNGRYNLIWQRFGAAAGFGAFTAGGKIFIGCDCTGANPLALVLDAVFFGPDVASADDTARWTDLLRRYYTGYTTCLRQSQSASIIVPGTVPVRNAPPNNLQQMDCDDWRNVQFGRPYGRLFAPKGTTINLLTYATIIAGDGISRPSVGVRENGGPVTSLGLTEFPAAPNAPLLRSDPYVTQHDNPIIEFDGGQQDYQSTTPNDGVYLSALDLPDGAIFEPLPRTGFIDIIGNDTNAYFSLSGDYTGGAFAAGAAMGLGAPLAGDKILLEIGTQDAFFWAAGYANVAAFQAKIASFLSGMASTSAAHFYIQTLPPLSAVPPLGTAASIRAAQTQAPVDAGLNPARYTVIDGLLAPFTDQPANDGECNAYAAFLAAALGQLGQTTHVVAIVDGAGASYAGSDFLQVGTVNDWITDY